MFLLDANIILEVLYKRSRWRESYKLLNRVKKGEIQATILHFTIHGISAILGKPKTVSRFLSEISSWKGLRIIELTLEEEIIASQIAEKVNLDFDDGLQYYYAKKNNMPIISYDKDFDELDIKRLEPKQVA